MDSQPPFPHHPLHFCCNQPLVSLVFTILVHKSPVPSGLPGMWHQPNLYLDPGTCPSTHMSNSLTSSYWDWRWHSACWDWGTGLFILFHESSWGKCLHQGPGDTAVSISLAPPPNGLNPSSLSAISLPGPHLTASRPLLPTCSNLHPTLSVPIYDISLQKALPGKPGLFNTYTGIKYWIRVMNSKVIFRSVISIHVICKNFQIFVLHVKDDVAVIFIPGLVMRFIFWSHK